MLAKQIGCRRARGVSLIEVAVSLLVLSIGAIGLAGLQISAKRAGFEAVQRSQATALAMEIMERIRANNGVIDEYVTAGIGSNVRDFSAVTEPSDCTAAACTESAIALRDLWEWERSINGASTTQVGNPAVGGLLNPKACITATNTGSNGRLVLVELAWEGNTLVDPNAGSGCGKDPGDYEPGTRQLLQMTTYVGEF